MSTLLEEIVAIIGIWRFLLLVGVYKIWFTKPLSTDRSHHFDYWFLFVLAATCYLLAELVIFGTELIVALARLRRISRVEIAARIITLLLAMLPSVVARLS